jgi:hypothetical protein
MKPAVAANRTADDFQTRTDDQRVMLISRVFIVVILSFGLTVVAVIT